jgi:hypothetical protein
MILQKSMLIKLFFAYYWSCGSSGICLTMGKRIHHHDVQHRICLSHPRIGCWRSWPAVCGCVALPVMSGPTAATWTFTWQLGCTMLHYVAPFRQLLHWKARNYFVAHGKRHLVLGQSRLKCFRISFRRGIHAVDSRPFSQSNSYCQLLSTQPRMENTLLVGMPMMKPCFKENIRIVASLLQAQ